MPASLYTRLEATVRRLLDKYGKPAQVLRKGAPVGPPHNPMPGPDVEHECQFVETTFDIENRTDTIIGKADKLGIVSPAVAVVPALEDRIRIDGRVYQLGEVRPLNPGGVTLFYKIHAKA